MTLPEKLGLLRRGAGWTQEELAERCLVSRQSVSKWEAGVAQPELEKLLLLSELFRVPVDVLVRDEQSVDGTRSVPCGHSALQDTRQALFEGILIKESLADENVLDLLRIHRVELWRTEGHPRYWTALTFSSNHRDLPSHLSKALLPRSGDTGWFVDFKSGDIKYIVFHGSILHYRIGNAQERERVRQACREQGITDEHMNWSE